MVAMMAMSFNFSVQITGRYDESKTLVWSDKNNRRRLYRHSLFSHIPQMAFRTVYVRRLEQLRCVFLNGKYITSMLHISRQVSALKATRRCPFFQLSSFSVFSPRRYYAIVKPLKYPINMTKRKVFIMIFITWISPALLSFVPIFAGMKNLLQQGH